MRETKTNKKPRILIIEDNADTLILNKTIFQSEGFLVVCAKTAGESLTLLDRECNPGAECFDAVLLDYDLPDITGATLGKYIRNNYKDIAIVILTGYGKLPALTRSAAQMGATLLNKPIEPEELVKEVRRAIKGNDKRSINLRSPITSTSVRHILQLAKTNRRLSNA